MITETVSTVALPRVSGSLRTSRPSDSGCFAMFPMTILKQYDLSGTDTKILLGLIWLTFESGGICSVTNAEIAEAAGGMSWSTCHRSMQSLKALGLIEISHEAGAASQVRLLFDTRTGQSCTHPKLAIHSETPVKSDSVRTITPVKSDRTPLSKVTGPPLSDLTGPSYLESSRENLEIVVVEQPPESSSTSQIPETTQAPSPVLTPKTTEAPAPALPVPSPQTVLMAEPPGSPKNPAELETWFAKACPEDIEFISSKFSLWISTYPVWWIQEAILIGMTNVESDRPKYIHGILRKWKPAGGPPLPETPAKASTARPAFLTAKERRDQEWAAQPKITESKMWARMKAKGFIS